jgi:hypothetical protein
MSVDGARSQCPDLNRLIVNSASRRVRKICHSLGARPPMRRTPIHFDLAASRHRGERILHPIRMGDCRSLGSIFADLLLIAQTIVGLARNLNSYDDLEGKTHLHDCAIVVPDCDFICSALLARAASRTSLREIEPPLSAQHLDREALNPLRRRPRRHRRLVFWKRWSLGSRGT